MLLLRRVVPLLLAFLLPAVLPLPASAQGGSVAEDAALRAFRATGAALSLSAAGGAELFGASSTLGRRLAGVPRTSFALRAGLSAPDLPEPADPDPALAGDRAWIPSLTATATVSVFDGFSVAPTVAGILAVDLLATGGFVAGPSGRGWDGQTNVYGLGARVGVVRESFTMPGVTLSATQRWLNDTSWGAPRPGDRVGGDWGGTATSVRAVVGKEFFAYGLLLGGGWDRIDGAGEIRWYDGAVGPQPGGPGPVSRREVEDVEDERLLGFVGVNWNLLVLQIAAEAGWAVGLDRGPGPEDGFTPDAGAPFGSLALRLIL